MSAVLHSAYEAAAYSVPQAARYLGMNAATLRGWIGPEGVLTSTAQGISFNTLLEAHVVKALRRKDRVPMQRIRRALAELARTHASSHPLLEHVLETDGLDLFLRDEAGVANLSRNSQREFRELASLYLRRITRGSDGRITDFRPFILDDAPEAPQTISISPVVSFGKPVLAGTGIATAVVAGRFNAGDSMQELAAEYQVPMPMLEDAIRWENTRKAA